jgi:hypothetical protein
MFEDLGWGGGRMRERERERERERLKFLRIQKKNCLRKLQNALLREQIRWVWEDI